MLAIFLDTESTGLDSKKFAILEVAFKVIEVFTGEIKASYQAVIHQPLEVWNARDPHSIEINGFTWEEVSQGKDPKHVEKEIINLLTSLKIERGKAVFICQNPGFDRGFFAQLIDIYTQEKLKWPYHWLDFASMYWALKMKSLSKDTLPQTINLSKNEIAKQYLIAPETDPHRAMNGVDHLILCYKTVIGYANAPTEIKDL